MSAKHRKSSEPIRQFILRSVAKGATRGIAKRTAERFEIAISSANSHIKSLVDEGQLLASGNTRARTYQLATLSQDQLSLDLAVDSDESAVWDRWLSGKLANDSPNLRAICQHGFTEILNNAIDHSDSPDARLYFKRTPVSVELIISDYGIGIFRKISEALDLESHQQALIELAKGKLTTDPARHSGEGIFFTSRMFDEFMIISDALTFSHDTESASDWLLEELPSARRQGTHVFMTIDVDSQTTTTEVFDRFASDFKDFGFSKTNVPVRMMLHEGDRLVSRSQARRLLSRVERFDEVILDFEGIGEVGQAFADEIFRVFAQRTPNTSLFPLNASEEVRKMISRAQSKKEI